MSSGKQFTLHGDVIGPNPLKVAVVLEELGLEYDLKLNPNGRVPALVDHSNGDFTIWESDAILLYLVEKYDKEHKLSVADVNEKFKLIQWLFFQASGQGPYFGQAVWFMKYHQEKIPSAIERYQKEIRCSVLLLHSWNEMAVGFGLEGVEGGNVEKEFQWR